MCPYCKMDPETKIYEDRKMLIFNCATCAVPMVVLKRHASEPTWEEKHLIHEVITKLFGSYVKLDVHLQQIPPHWGAHIITAESSQEPG